LWLARKVVFSKWQQSFGGKLKFVISGGAALQPRLSRLFFAAGIPLMEGYGMTETSPVIAANHLTESGCLRIGTVGPKLKNIEVKIDQDGEILVKGPCVMVGDITKIPRPLLKLLIKTAGFMPVISGLLKRENFLKLPTGRKRCLKHRAENTLLPRP
jgi:long-chain acyl-CoA synthetase